MADRSSKTILQKTDAMPANTITASDIAVLRNAVFLPTEKKAMHLQQLLTVLSKKNCRQVTVIKAYHDTLLFLKAYPPGKEVLHAANAAMELLCADVKKIMEGSNNVQQRSLSGTGIAGTLLTAQFGYSITSWLQQYFGQHVYYDAATADAAMGATILQQVLPTTEYYCGTQGNFSTDKRVQMITPGEDRLNALLSLFKAYKAGEKTKEFLFDQLKVYTSWKLDNTVFNRSNIKGVELPIFWQHDFIKKPDASAIINQPCPPTAALSPHQKQQLCNVAKASLAFYHRETEAITHADPSRVSLYNCGRGLYIALFGMKPSHQLSLESYIGYMAFKNNIPVAYGGGWMFGERCKIGLNIYPPFRKGESAVLFCEVMRLYRSQFNIQRFIVKPYQFGKGNKEGLESAAFWFYYKLGYRPADEKIAARAATAFTSGEKSGIPLLKFFTGSNLQLNLNPVLHNDNDPERWSEQISWLIKTMFEGNRQKAISHSYKKMKSLLTVDDKTLRSRKIKEWGLLLLLLPGLNKWPKADLKKLAAVIKARVNNEKNYILETGKCTRLLKELSKL